jgi:vacuolar-type H+-ATPase subunit I/STV1
MSSQWSPATDHQLGARIDRLARVVGELEDEIDHLKNRALPSVEDGVRAVSADLESLQELVEENTETLHKHDKTTRELSADTKRLAVRIQWIEQHIRASGTAQTADLDTDTELTVLAATMDKGLAAEARLIPQSRRSALQYTVELHRSAVTRHAEAVDQVLAACRQLADTAIDDPAHRAARRAFTASKAARTSAAGEVNGLRNNATAYKSELEADTRLRQQLAPVIAKGTKARADLMTRLRTRLADAVGRAKLLPIWMTTPMGPMPPAENTDAWMEIATSLWAYRVTYAITDPVLALGKMPSNAPAWRRQWSHELETSMRDLRG